MIFHVGVGTAIGIGVAIAVLFYHVGWSFGFVAQTSLAFKHVEDVNVVLAKAGLETVPNPFKKGEI